MPLVPYERQIRDRHSHLTRTQSREAALIRRGWPAPGHIRLQVEGQPARTGARSRNRMAAGDLGAAYPGRTLRAGGQAEPLVGYLTANGPQTVNVLNHATVWRRPSSNGTDGS